MDPTKIGIVVLLLLLCWMAQTLLKFYHAKKSYNVLQEKAEGIRKKLSQNTLQELQIAQEKNVCCIANLSDWFKKYQIILPEERILRNPEQFYKQLKTDLLLIQEKAKNKSITLPPLFSLGFANYEKTPLTSDENLQRSKQEFALFWITDHLCEYNQLNVLQFSFENKIKNLELIKAQELGFVTLIIRTRETSFQKFFNEIANAPYYFVIKKVTVENSNKNGPPHSSENKQDAIKIVLGREELNITMKIQILDFN